MPSADDGSSEGGLHYAAVIAVALTLAAMGVGAGFVIGSAPSNAQTPADNQTQLEPGQVVVDTSEALDQKNGLGRARQGPTGSVVFSECEGENCTVSVNVSTWNHYEMLKVAVYADGETLEMKYLHPEDERLTFEDVPKESTTRLVVPVSDSDGYKWSESYSMRHQAENRPARTEREFNALVVEVIINEDYFFRSDLPENETEAEKE